MTKPKEAKHEKMHTLGQMYPHRGKYTLKLEFCVNISFISEQRPADIFTNWIQELCNFLQTFPLFD